MIVKSVTDEEIAEAFLNTNFGITDYRAILKSAMLKKLVGYHCGHTITNIMEKLGLIGKSGKPIKRGIQFIRESYAPFMMHSG